MKPSNVKLSTKQTLPTGNQSKPALTKSTGVQAGKLQDAIALLKADHKEVDGLLKQYEKAEDTEKEALANRICSALSVHAQIEEEIFYPAAREALDEADIELINEADVEHGSIKQLIAQVESSSPEDEHYDANVKVIGEYVKHHVKEEEEELFPKLAKNGDLDLKAIGAEMAERKAELTAESDA